MQFRQLKGFLNGKTCQRPPRTSTFFNDTTKNPSKIIKSLFTEILNQFSIKIVHEASRLHISHSKLSQLSDVSIFSVFKLVLPSTKERNYVISIYKKLNSLNFNWNDKKAWKLPENRSTGTVKSKEIFSNSIFISGNPQEGAKTFFLIFNF